MFLLQQHPRGTGDCSSSPHTARAFRLDGGAQGRQASVAADTGSLHRRAPVGLPTAAGMLMVTGRWYNSNPCFVSSHLSSASNANSTNEGSRRGSGTGHTRPEEAPDVAPDTASPHLVSTKGAEALRCYRALVQTSYLIPRRPRAQVPSPSSSAPPPHSPRA